MKSIIVAIASFLLITQGASWDVDPVMARLDAYLTDYEPKLSELIADEEMTQEIPAGALNLMRGRVPASASQRRRRIHSEVAFIALPNGGWLGFRHVKTINNVTVKDSDTSLAGALQKTALDSARELLESSAAHNLGLPRTTNLPNLPLEFLHVRNRKRLLPRIDGEDTVRGVRTVRLVLLERMTPSLIRNPTTGNDMPSVIRAWVDPTNGRLMRAEVNTFPGPKAMEVAENTIRVEFAENKQLGLLVPIEMRERFPIATEYRGSSVANYSNFRRFTTSARIIPQ